MSVFAAAAAVGLNEAASTVEPMTKQVSALTDVVKTTSSLQATMQHPAAKRDPANEKNPTKSLDDMAAIMMGIQQTTAKVLSAVGEDITSLHQNLTLKLLQPGAMPDAIVPGKKPSRDTIAQMELSRAVAQALKGLATSNALKRTNEVEAVAAKGFYRQAGSFIFDTAGVILQTALVSTVRSLKHLISVTDLDVIADTVSYHVKTFVMGVQKVVWLVAKDFTLSIGGKSKLVLMDKAEIVAMQDAIATLSGKVEVLTTQQMKFYAAIGVTIKSNMAQIEVSDAGIVIAATGTPSLTIAGPGGLGVQITPAGINFGPVLPPPVVTPEVAVPVALPNPAGPEPSGGAKLKAPVATATNVGRSSAAAHVPHADGMGELKT